MTKPFEFKKIGEIEFKPLNYPQEIIILLFQVFRLADGSYQALIKKHPLNANIKLPDRWYQIGEIIIIMKIFKNGKIISNDLPDKIMEIAKREAILLRLE